MNEIEKIKEFIDFIENPPKKKKLEILEHHLISIYLIFVVMKYREGKVPKIQIAFEGLRNKLSPNFKELGPYNDVLEIKDNLGNTELTTRDAIDDLTDIVKAIKESLTLKSDKDVLSNIKVTFEIHFKNHLINLLRYLNNDI